MFEIGLLILVAVAMLAMAGLFYYYTHREARLDQTRSPLVDTRRLPPEPRLQADPAQELIQLRAVEQEGLTGYAWVDQEQNLVSIPIEKAIDILAERGLPTRPQQEGSGE
jgi:hypothetical protein